jgi:hypothetical protein
VAAIVTIYYVGVQLYYWRFDVAHWDVLALSGWLTVTVGLRVAEALPDRLHQMLQRLTNRGLLPDDSADTSLTSALDDRSRRWSWIGGPRLLRSCSSRRPSPSPGSSAPGGRSSPSPCPAASSSGSTSAA